MHIATFFLLMALLMFLSACETPQVQSVRTTTSSTQAWTEGILIDAHTSHLYIRLSNGSTLRALFDSPYDDLGLGFPWDGLASNAIIGRRCRVLTRPSEHFFDARGNRVPEVLRFELL
jgi:hypothetical protein